MTYTAILIVVTLLFAAIAWRDVRHGLLLLAASLPTYLLRFDLGPIPMTLLEAFALVLVAVWIAKTRPSWRTVVPSGWLLPIALLLAAATVSVLVAPDALSALGIWKTYFVEPMLVFLVASDSLRRHPEDRDRLFVALGAGGLFVAVCAIVQSLTGWGLPAPWDVEGRVVSIFPYPNAVGLYLAPVIVIAMGYWILDIRNWRRTANFYYLLSAILMFIAIVLSQSEAAIVAVVVTLFLAAVATKRLRWYAVAAAAMAVVAVALSPFRQTVFDKLTFNDFSGQVRRSQWSETVTMLGDRALLGAGLNGYPAAMEPYHEAVQYEIFQYPHTIALNVWTELGLLGLVAFAALAATVFRFQFSVFSPTINSKNSKPITENPTLPAFLALLAMSIHGLADVPYFKNDLAMMTWLLLAVVAATSYAKVHGKHV